MTKLASMFEGTFMRKKGFLGISSEVGDESVVGAQHGTDSIAFVVDGTGAGIAHDQAYSEEEEWRLFYPNARNADAWLELGTEGLGNDCYIYANTTDDSGMHEMEKDHYLKFKTFGRGETGAHIMEYSGKEFTPTTDNVCKLGTSTARWSQIYVVSPNLTPATRSDVKFAKARSGETEAALEIGRLINRYKDEGGRICYGVRAEDVLAIMEKHGLPSEHYGIVYEEDGVVSMCYEQLHAFVIKAVVEKLSGL